MDIVYMTNVEKDEYTEGKYKIVIYNECGTVFGVPMRGVSKKVAESSVKAIQFAFEYGLTAQAMAPPPHVTVKPFCLNDVKTVPTVTELDAMLQRVAKEVKK